MNGENYLYEWATLRCVPRIERDEFLNIGVIMMCKRRKWVRVETFVRPELIGIFAPSIDPAELDRHLAAFKAIADGRPDAGPIAQMEPEERFRWLTAVKSTWLQTSRPHPGLTPDLDSAFDRIMQEQVKS